VAAQQAAADSFVGPPRPNPAQVAAQQGAGLGALAAGAPKPAAAGAGAGAGAPKPAAAGAGAPKPANRPAAVVAAEAEAAEAAAAAAAERPPAGRPTAVAAEEGVAAANRPPAAAVVAAEEGAATGAGSRMAAVRAATGEGRGSGFSALLPAVLAAGAGTGSGASSAPEATPFFDRTSGDDTRGFPAITPEIKKEAVAAAKAEIPKEDRKGFGYEDLMMFGLQLMAGKSQYALQNVGEAGVAALTAKQAREKVEYDRRKTDAEIKGLEASARYHGAYAQSLEADTKTDSAMRMKAATLAQNELEKWAALPQNFNATPAQVTAKRDELMRAYFQVLGQAGTMGGAGGKTGNPLVDKYLQ